MTTHLIRISILSVCVMLLSARISSAQTTSGSNTSPRTLSYQGVISAAGGNKIAGEHLLTITLYGDDQGTVKLWQNNMQTTLDSTGIFNCALGTADNPLPNAQTMDRPIWLGISIDGGIELRPLTQVTASAYALNVADNAITTAKLADGAVTADKLNVDYISAVTVDGQRVTNKVDSLNFVSGNGIQFQYDSVTKQISASAPKEQVILKNGGAGTSSSDACSSTNSDGGDGTNIVAGGCDNTMDSVTNHCVIAGGEVNTIDSADHSSIGGGEGNTITPGWRIPGTDADPVSYSTIAGGHQNTVNDPGTFIGGGENNVAGEEESSVVGGEADTVLSPQSVIAGGYKNRIGITNIEFGSDQSFIGGGYLNTIDAIYSAISGGEHNRVESGAGASFIGAGNNNHIQSESGVISGGESNAILLGSVESDYHSAIGGGKYDTIYSSLSDIAGGYRNRIDTFAHYSAIGGGRQNLIQGPYSVIAGGDSNYIYNIYADHNVISGGLDNIEQNPSFGVIAGGWNNLLDTVAWGSSIGGGDSNIVKAQISVIGGGRYNSIRYIYDYAATIGGGQSNQIWNGTGGFIGGGLNNFAGYFSNTVVGGYTDSSVSPLGFLGGGLFNRIDWNSDSASVLVGGACNYVRGGWGFLGGGMRDSIIFSQYAVLGGGQNNKIDYNSDHSVLAGGDSNYTRSNHAFLGGGRRNKIDDTSIYSVIGGGRSNYVNFPYSVLVGGQSNTVNAEHSFMGGGSLDTIGSPSQFSVIEGGRDNRIYSYGYIYTLVLGSDAAIGDFDNGYSTIGGGLGNNIRSTLGVIAGGVWNKIDTGGVLSVVSGGQLDTIKSALAAIGGGVLNSVTSSGMGAAIPGGIGLVAQSLGQFVAGTYNIPNGGLTPSPDDALAIFGNGEKAARSNAFEISYNGHTTVYGKNDNTYTSPGHIPTYGATYTDNTVVAWGDVKADGSTNADLGIYNITHLPNSGIYVITLKIKDPTSPGSYVTLSSASITVSEQDNTDPSSNIFAGGAATSSQIGVGGTNSFVVRTYNELGIPPQLWDLPFFFKVCAR